MKKSEDIEGFRGNEDMDSILQFLGKFYFMHTSILSSFKALIQYVSIMGIISFFISNNFLMGLL